MVKQTFFLFTFLIFTASVCSQSVTDSLIQLIERTSDDSLRFELYMELSYTDMYVHEEKAKSAANMALSYAEKIDCEYCRARAIGQHGNVSYVNSHFSESVDDYIRALRIARKIKNDRLISVLTGNLGNVEYSMENHLQASRYYQEALEAAKRLRDTATILSNLNNLTSLFIEQNALIEAELLVFELHDILDQKEDEYFRARANFQMAKIRRLQKNKTEALALVERVLEYCKANEDFWLIIDAYITKGGIHVDNGDFGTAQQAFNSAVTYARMTESSEQLMITYNNITDLYVRLDQFEEAYNYHLEYSRIKDSLRSVEKQRHVDELREQFNADVQEKENEILKKENALKDLENESQMNRTRMITFTSIGGGALLIAFIFFQLRNNRVLKGANKEITFQRDMISMQKNEITDSINYARNIQDSIIPDDDEFKTRFEDHFVLYRPKDVVSGDFYWIEEAHGKVYWSVVDCTGHGVPGAMVSIVGFNILNKVLLEYGLTDPAKILDRMARMVEEAFDRSDAKIRDGMDLGLCCYDPRTRELRFSGANNGVWIIRRNELTVIRPDKQPIGKYEYRKPFTTHKVQLEPYDLVILYSDGYADQFGGESGKKFKSNNLKKLLKTLSDQKGSDIARELDTTFRNWKGDIEQIDDVCIIGVRV